MRPLGLFKLDLMLGSIERVFGLNIAERIGSFKVCLRTKNPRTFKSGSVKDDVENIGDGGSGDIAFQVAPFNLLEKGDRTLDKGFPFQD